MGYAKHSLRKLKELFKQTYSLIKLKELCKRRKPRFWKKVSLHQTGLLWGLGICSKNAGAAMLSSSCMGQLTPNGGSTRVPRIVTQSRPHRTSARPTQIFIRFHGRVPCSWPHRSVRQPSHLQWWRVPSHRGFLSPTPTPDPGIDELEELRQRLPLILSS